MWCDGVPHERCEPWAWVEQRRSREGVGVLLEAGRAWGFWFFCRGNALLSVLLKQCPRALDSFALVLRTRRPDSLVSLALYAPLPGQRLEPLVGGASLVLGDQSPADGPPEHGPRGAWSGGVAARRTLGPAGGEKQGGRGQGQACWGHHLSTTGTSWAAAAGSAPDSCEVAAG